MHILVSASHFIAVIIRLARCNVHLLSGSIFPYFKRRDSLRIRQTKQNNRFSASPWALTNISGKCPRVNNVSLLATIVQGKQNDQSRVRTDATCNSLSGERVIISEHPRCNCNFISHRGIIKRGIRSFYHKSGDVIRKYP